jgi:hypothetical protein
MKRAVVVATTVGVLATVWNEKASPPEKPAPLFPTLTVGAAASGTTSLSRSVVFSSFPSPDALNQVRPTIILHVGTATPKETLPPPWASDEQRGVRKKFKA